ncbi:sensor domain-containing diguanylate cyclase [Catenovulum sp. 2E275]|uniref:sensor domain-containing diguanylate cyclase n=1 Tax=Catenovulum sp. 2E275 TaxID=2980497 RepID=UPI0021D11158|nr:sensor domain-containing diguanylate cyclase [Catenovulum sp. 2E275]MCU4675194.1 sensor domain-containing diguanylate cyclase [Catenovulum sp. 2E275]
MRKNKVRLNSKPDFVLGIMSKGMSISIPVHFIERLNEAKNLDDTLNCITIWLPQLLPAERASITFSAKDKERLKVYSFQGNSAIAKSLDIPVATTFVGKVFESQQADIAICTADSKFDDCKMLYGNGLTTCLDVPLIKAGVCFGTINIAHSKSDIYTHNHLCYLVNLANLLAPFLFVYHELNSQTKLATTDELTGIANRRAFFSFANKLMHAWLESNKKFFILMIDLDYFKEINDTLGHPVGDEVLKAFSQNIIDIIPKDALFSRVGGEEFAIVYPCQQASDATNLADLINKISHQTAKPILSENICLTVSIGITQVSPSDLKIDHTVARADKALYMAKANGRNQYSVV